MFANLPNNAPQSPPKPMTSHLTHCSVRSLLAQPVFMVRIMIGRGCPPADALSQSDLQPRSSLPSPLCAPSGRANCSIVPICAFGPSLSDGSAWHTAANRSTKDRDNGEVDNDNDEADQHYYHYHHQLDQKNCTHASPRPMKLTTETTRSTRSNTANTATTPTLPLSLS